MDTFTKLFGSLVSFAYHCFDRIVILGYLPLLTRPENIVHFYRDVHQVGAITKEVLRQRNDDYIRWVDSFARNRSPRVAIIACDGAHLKRQPSGCVLGP